jgi:hypothetical protein
MLKSLGIKDSELGDVKFFLEKLVNTGFLDWATFHLILPIPKETIRRYFVYFLPYMYTPTCFMSLIWIPSTPFLSVIYLLPIPVHSRSRHIKRLPVQ